MDLWSFTLDWLPIFSSVNTQQLQAIDIFLLRLSGTLLHFHPEQVIQKQFHPDNNKRTRDLETRCNALFFIWITQLDDTKIWYFRHCEQIIKVYLKIKPFSDSHQQRKLNKIAGFIETSIQQHIQKWLSSALRAKSSKVEMVLTSC